MTPEEINRKIIEINRIVIHLMKAYHYTRDNDEAESLWRQICRLNGDVVSFQMAFQDALKRQTEGEKIAALAEQTRLEAIIQHMNYDLARSAIPLHHFEQEADEEESEEEEFEENPAHGDTVTCCYCGTDFAFMSLSDQVGPNMFWCGCADETEEDQDNELEDDN